MKRFLIRVITYLFVVSIISLLINFAYVRLDHSDSDGVMKFETMPQTIEICNFGSSHGQFGFNYDDLCGVDSFNFGLSAQTISYDLRMFENYCDRISKGSVVFLPVSYFSLFGTKDEDTEGFYERNKRYYKVLPADLIKEYDIITDVYVNCLPSLCAGEKLIDVFLGTQKNVIEEKCSAVSTSIDIRTDAYEAYKRHIVYDKTDNDGEWIKNQEEIDSLKTLVTKCKNKGLFPILITVPCLHDYTDIIEEKSPQFFHVFQSVIDEVCKETGVKYYDYSHDDRFSNKYNWFMNSDHLNRIGAREFVKVLMDEVVDSISA